MPFLRPAIALLLASSLHAEGSGGGPVARVLEAVRETTALEADLHALCDGVGSRMAGTDGMRKALQWARHAFEGAAVTNVRLEPVPMPLRWQEGDTRIEVVAPTEFRLRVAATALSPAIEQPTEAELVDGGSGRPGSISRNADRFRGKVALVELDEVDSFDQLGVEQRDALVALDEATDAGALAVLFVSTRPGRLLYRHVNNVAGTLDAIPSALVARSDGLRLLRLLRGGQTVRVRIALPNRIGGPYDTANVVAELPGTDLPDEIVLLGAHLDSWDMGTGCLDNATNVALVVHVARSIAASGARPRRTMRFVLFGGEELGLFGSRAYVARHAAELDRHVATIVHDMGGGALLGYSVGARDGLLAPLEAVLGRRGPFGEYRHTREAFFMSDNFTFLLHGVPSLFAVQDTSDFYLTYHSEADTYDQVQIEHVARSAEVAATAAMGIADGQSRFGERLEREEVLGWLRRDGLVRHLRFMGVWDSWWPPVVSDAAR